VCHENGVDVIQDKSDLQEGHDAHACMEKMVADPSIREVAMISDQKSRIYIDLINEFPFWWWGERWKEKQRDEEKVLH
jgi:hypothetical protein